MCKRLFNGDFCAILSFRDVAREKRKGRRMWSGKDGQRFNLRCGTVVGMPLDFSFGQQFSLVLQYVYHYTKLSVYILCGDFV